ncbi:MAG: type 1 periplasmic-binding domain-containing protein [Mycobacteriales bacterium]
MYSLNDAAASAGVNNNTTVTPGNAVHALVASYNATGGFDGHRIVPVYAELKSSSDNYESDLAAACASFTQDNHVAAVISNLGLYSESFLNCLAKASVPVVSSDAGPDIQDAKEFPLLVTPDSLVGDTRVVEVVTRLKASGWLTSGDRIGVIIEDCPVNVRIFNNSLVPALRQAGLTLAATAEPECFQGIQDLGAISGEMTNAVVQFRSRNVTRVMFVSQAQEGTMAYEFMLAAGNQNWYPGYALSSASDATDLQGQSGVSTKEISNSRGIGWIPPLDTVNLSQVTTTPAARQCAARVRGQGLRPATEIDYVTVDGACDTFAVYDAVLHAASGDSSAAAFARGLGLLGDHFESALTLNGKTGYWDRGRLSPAEGRYFAYIASQGGFVYTGNPFSF